MLSSRSTLAQDRSSPVPPANMSRNQGTTLFMFGDSSGDSSRSAKSLNMSPYYIICTVILDSVELIRINSLMIKLKKMHFAGRNPLRVELHGSLLRQMLSSFTHDKSATDKKFDAIFTDIVNIACGTNAKIHVTVTNKSSLEHKYNHVYIETSAWSKLALLFGHVLRTQPCPTVGIIILDKYDPGTAATINHALTKTLRQFKANNKNSDFMVMPNPLFVESASSNVVQLADMIAFIVARHYKSGNDPQFERWYTQLNSKFGSVVKFMSG